MTMSLDPALRDRLSTIHTGSLSDALGSIGVLVDLLNFRDLITGSR